MDPLLWLFTGLLCTLGNGLDPVNGHKTVIELYGPVGIRYTVHDIVTVIIVNSTLYSTKYTKEPSTHYTL